MTAPIKPWERNNINSSSPNTSSVNNQSSLGMNVPDCCKPPALPTRPAQQSSGPAGFGGFGNGFGTSYGGYNQGGGLYNTYGGGGLGGGLYNGGNMYSNSMYGGGGYMNQNRFNNQDQNSSLVRMAEENSRQAFQSIEGIVQAFGSVAMMLDSTFQACYNSFRAVIGVADHFTRMKTHLTQIFSAMAVIRTIKWMYRKLLVLLRLREAGVSEEVWSAAAENAFGASPGGTPRSNWPIMMFFAVVLGGPWLIWRLLSSLTQANDGSGWSSGKDPHFVGEAKFDFPQAQQGELSFRQGQRVILAPKELQPRIRGWLLASVDGQTTGLVPANYIKVLGKRDGLRPQDATAPHMQESAPSVHASGVVGDTQPHGSGSQAGSTATSCCSKSKTKESCDKSQSDSSPSVNSPSTREFVSSLEDFSEFNSSSNGVPLSEKDASDILDDGLNYGN